MADSFNYSEGVPLTWKRKSPLHCGTSDLRYEYFSCGETVLSPFAAGIEADILFGVGWDRPPQKD